MFNIILEILATYVCKAFEAFPKEFHIRRKTPVALIACDIGHANVMLSCSWLWEKTDLS